MALNSDEGGQRPPRVLRAARWVSGDFQAAAGQLGGASGPGPARWGPQRAVAAHRARRPEAQRGSTLLARTAAAASRRPASSRSPRSPPLPPAEGAALPLRLLDGFVIHVPGDRSDMVQLENLQAVAPRAVATGLLHAADAAAAGGERAQVTTGAILDWCLDLGEQPGVWIMTDQAW